MLTQIFALQMHKGCPCAHVIRYKFKKGLEEVGTELHYFAPGPVTALDLEPEKYKVFAINLASSEMQNVCHQLSVCHQQMAITVATSDKRLIVATSSFVFIIK